MGFVSNYKGLYAARFFLGVTEVWSASISCCLLYSIDTDAYKILVWFLPCVHVPPNHLVPALRGSASYGRLLLRGLACGCFFWLVSICY